MSACGLGLGKQGQTGASSQGRSQASMSPTDVANTTKTMPRNHQSAPVENLQKEMGQAPNFIKLN